MSRSLFFPKNGMILSLIMYSLVFQVFSRMKGLMSSPYTSTKSAKRMSREPLVRRRKLSSNSSASSAVAKPLLHLCLVLP